VPSFVQAGTGLTLDGTKLDANVGAGLPVDGTGRLGLSSGYGLKLAAVGSLGASHANVVGIPPLVA